MNYWLAPLGGPHVVRRRRRGARSGSRSIFAPAPLLVCVCLSFDVSQVAAAVAGVAAAKPKYSAAPPPGGLARRGGR